MCYTYIATSYIIVLQCMLLGVTAAVWGPHIKSAQSEVSDNTLLHDTIDTYVSVLDEPLMHQPRMQQ